MTAAVLLSKIRQRPMHPYPHRNDRMRFTNRPAPLYINATGSPSRTPNHGFSTTPLNALPPFISAVVRQPHLHQLRLTHILSPVFPSYGEAKTAKVVGCTVLSLLFSSASPSSFANSPALSFYPSTLTCQACPTQRLCSLRCYVRR